MGGGGGGGGCGACGGGGGGCFGCGFGTGSGSGFGAASAGAEKSRQKLAAPRSPSMTAVDGLAVRRKRTIPHADIVPLFLSFE